MAESEKRRELVVIRLTKQERAEIAERAQKARVGASTYIRQAVFGVGLECRDQSKRVAGAR